MSLMYFQHICFTFYVRVLGPYTKFSSFSISHGDILACVHIGLSIIYLAFVFLLNILTKILISSLLPCHLLEFLRSGDNWLSTNLHLTVHKSG